MEKTLSLTKIVFKKIEGKLHTHLGKIAFPMAIRPDVVALGNIFHRGERRF